MQRIHVVRMPGDNRESIPSLTEDESATVQSSRSRGTSKTGELLDVTFTHFSTNRGGPWRALSTQKPPGAPAGNCNASKSTKDV